MADLFGFFGLQSTCVQHITFADCLVAFDGCACVCVTVGHGWESICKSVLLVVISGWLAGWDLNVMYK